ncbi:hypothetical protein [Crassaminicella thermophila]|uniref:hypothetical protein n=1 Tax=Crassaminicella thermophila TaxID=2599308 RepID=UPI00143CD648|nr:hypothetical protein [Crassaminicella thermophila]
MDFEELRLKVVKEMKEKLVRDGTSIDNLVEVLIELSSKVSKNMLQEYHDQINQKG